MENGNLHRAGVTQLVECDLAKVDVAGSNPVSRSKKNPAFHTTPAPFPVRYNPRTVMAESASVQRTSAPDSATIAHSSLVRVTHWIAALSILGLLVSGGAILVAHPRFYWGETGSVGTPSLFDLPIPFLFGHSGWGRYLHFLSAWVCVLTGVVYALYGFRTKHFRRALLPRRAAAPFTTYNPVQRLTYLVVIFILFPGIIITGLAMSPAIVSVLPEIVTVFGGQQSARTLHFFLADLVLLFLLVHVSMVVVNHRFRSMITGERRA